MRNTKTFLLLSSFALLVCLPALAMVQAAPPVAVASIPWAVKAIAIAAVVSSAIQGIKRGVPGLTGNVAQILNGLGAVTGSLALSSPGDWKTGTFWFQVVLTFSAAAGVHDLASFWGLFRSGGKVV